jgi:hypothetical protein
MGLAEEEWLERVVDPLDKPNRKVRRPQSVWDSLITGEVRNGFVFLAWEDRQKRNGEKYITQGIRCKCIHCDKERLVARDRFYQQPPCACQTVRPEWASSQMIRELEVSLFLRTGTFFDGFEYNKNLVEGIKASSDIKDYVSMDEMRHMAYPPVAPTPLARSMRKSYLIVGVNKQRKPAGGVEKLGVIHVKDGELYIQRDFAKAYLSAFIMIRKNRWDYAPVHMPTEKRTKPVRKTMQGYKKDPQGSIGGVYVPWKSWFQQ